MTPRPKYYAIDEKDGTFYVLVRRDHPPVSAHWPATLLMIEPDAEYAGTIGGILPPPVSPDMRDAFQIFNQEDR